MLDRNSFESFLNEAAEYSPHGWTFDGIEERFVNGALPWSYTSIALPFIAKSSCMLDLDTGGGEFLADLPFQAEITFATEGHSPNITVAYKRLRALNIPLIAVDNSTSLLPFKGNSFDLVLGRHAAFSWNEVQRVLKPGGIFISQQVGSDNHVDLNLLLGAAKCNLTKVWNLDTALNQASETGFSILSQGEAHPKDQIFDIGALLIHLKTVPWQIPDFNIDSYHSQLLKLHDRINASSFVEVTSHRFFFVAQKR